MKARLLLVLAVCLMIAAPGLVTKAQEATPADVPPWVCPEGFEGQKLAIYSWSTYVAEDTIANFDKACKLGPNPDDYTDGVTYDVYGSNEDMYGRLRQGNPGYDVAVPTGYFVAIMAHENLLEPLDMSKIPNFANVAETYVNPKYDPGNKYSVPYQAGTIGIGYNKAKVGEEITSWTQMWNYDGNVAWLNDPRAMFGIALKLLGFDPNTDNPDEINQARDYLIANGKNVVASANDDGQAALDRGDADMVIEYSGDIFQVMANCECDDYAYVIPADAGQLWTDNLVIPAGAPNKALAEAFLDYILDPKVGADISNYTAYITPNQKAIDLGLIDPETLNNPQLYPPVDVIDTMFRIDENPVGGPLMNEAWNEVLVMLGR